MTATLAIEGSWTVAVSGVIAEPTVMSKLCATGTSAFAGVTEIGGGVGAAIPLGEVGDALGAVAGADGAGCADDGDGEGDGV